MKKAVKHTFAAIGVFVGASYLTNILIEEKQRQEFTNYGTLVETKFGKMNVEIVGEEGPVIVLLPGYGNAAPILDFRPLAKGLSEFAKVITIEYLGYGFSEDTTRERTSAFICDEIHECLSVLGVDKYYLMPHSISGIYSLMMANQYPDEVAGVLGLDVSVAQQRGKNTWTAMVKMIETCQKLGFLRIASLVKPELINQNTEDDQLIQMSLWNKKSAAIKNEGEHIFSNLAFAESQSYASDLPVLMFVCSQNVKATEGWWMEAHQALVENLTKGEVVELEGQHSIYWTQAEAIVAKVKEFIL